jgi:hypothetical protein
VGDVEDRVGAECQGEERERLARIARQGVGRQDDESGRECDVESDAGPGLVRCRSGEESGMPAVRTERIEKPAPKARAATSIVRRPSDMCVKW